MRLFFDLQSFRNNLPSDVQKTHQPVSRYNLFSNLCRLCWWVLRPSETRLHNVVASLLFPGHTAIRTSLVFLSIIPKNQFHSTRRPLLYLRRPILHSSILTMWSGPPILLFAILLPIEIMHTSLQKLNQSLAVVLLNLLFPREASVMVCL